MGGAELQGLAGTLKARRITALPPVYRSIGSAGGGSCHFLFFFVHSKLVLYTAALFVYFNS